MLSSIYFIYGSNEHVALRLSLVSGSGSGWAFSPELPSKPQDNQRHVGNCCHGWRCFASARYILQFGQIHFVIWTNTFVKLYKNNLNNCQDGPVGNRGHGWKCFASSAARRPAAVGRISCVSASRNYLPLAWERTFISLPQTICGSKLFPDK